jgi:hypothetical protein
MLSCTAIQLHTDTLYLLLDFLRNTGSKLDVSAAADEAIRQWLARMQLEDGGLGPAPNGYQWKTLFLPEGTRLSVTCQGGESAYAYVVGDRLLFQGEPTSPNRFAKEASGYVRNAWTDISVRFPGEIRAKSAYALRRALERAAKERPPLPEAPRAYCPPAQPEPEPPAIFKSHKPPPGPDEWPYIDRRALRVYPDWEPF